MAKIIIVNSFGLHYNDSVWDKRLNQQVLTCALESQVSSMELTLNQKYLVSTSGKKVTFWDLARYFTPVSSSASSFGVSFSLLFLL